MMYSIHINQVRCVEWGIKPSLGGIVDLVNQASSWAQATVINGTTYYWVEPGKVAEELISEGWKRDTARRHMNTLKEKGIIDIVIMDGKYYVRLTEKGATWNRISQIRNTEKNSSAENYSKDARKKIRGNAEKNSPDNNNNNKYNQDNDTPLNPPEGETRTDSVAVLDHLNQRLADLSQAIGINLPKFRSVDTTLKNIKTRLSESSVDDCKLVIDYLVAKWGRNIQMREYLTPKTIFRASNFIEYHPKATAWAESGKPIFIDGAWVTEAEANRQAQLPDLPSVEEVRGVYHRYLSVPTLFNRTDFSDLRKKFVYYCVVKTKNAHPTEANINSVIAGAIKSVSANIHSLPIPNLGA